MIIKGISPSFAASRVSTRGSESSPATQPPSTSFSMHYSRLADANASEFQDVGPHRSPYQIKDGTRFAGLVADPLGSFKAPENLVQELDRRAKEEASREAMNYKYSYEHRYQTIGQVYVDGKLYAEVDEAGGYGSIRAIAGLSQADMSPLDRVKDIARALQGKGRVEIKHANFGPGLGGWSGPNAPEQMLPPYTARSMQAIHEEIHQLFEKQKTEHQLAMERATSQ